MIGPARASPFNSPLEAGVRSLAILTAAFPAYYDLERLVEFDYLAVHSGDVEGPQSLHAPVPLRSGELLVRRSLVERGLLLMLSRALVAREIGVDGFRYSATEATAPFLDSLTAPYIGALRERAEWAVTNLGQRTTAEIAAQTSSLFHRSQFETPNVIRSLL